MWDRKKGKLLGVNLFDLLVIAVFVFLAFMAISTAFKSSLNFDGEEVYKAVKAYNKMEKKGFLVEGEVEGKDIGNPYGESRVIEGVVKKAYGGTLEVENRYGDKTTVGGSMSYMEDFAASRVELKPLYRSVVAFYNAKRNYQSYSQFMESMEGLREESGAQHLVMEGEVQISRPSLGFPRFKARTEACYLCVESHAIKVDQGHYTTNLNLVDLKEMKGLKLSSGEVTLSKGFTIYLGYSQGLSRERVDRVYEILKSDGYLISESGASYVAIEELL